MESYLKELELTYKNETQRFQDELRSVRGNRPSIGIIEDVKVECYGQVLEIRELGSLSVRPPRDIEITVWDKAAIPAIVKAIETANSGLSVSAGGGEAGMIRVSLPPLTEERRKEFDKLVRKMSENARIQVRNRREETMKRLKAAQDSKELNEDQIFRAKEKVQKLTDEVNGRIESSLEVKIKELAD